MEWQFVGNCVVAGDAGRWACVSKCAVWVSGCMTVCVRVQYGMLRNTLISLLNNNGIFKLFRQFDRIT